MPTNDQILDIYFQSDDDDSDFEGFSEVGRFRDVEVHDFTERTEPVFPDGFNVETASPNDYFDLMFKPDMIGNIARNTNNYARWKMDQKGICPHEIKT